MESKIYVVTASGTGKTGKPYSIASRYMETEKGIRISEKDTIFLEESLPFMAEVRMDLVVVK